MVNVLLHSIPRLVLLDDVSAVAVTFPPFTVTSFLIKIPLLPFAAFPTAVMVPPYIVRLPPLIPWLVCPVPPFTVSEPSPLITRSYSHKIPQFQFF